MSYQVIAIDEDDQEVVLERNIMYEHTAYLIAGARSYNCPEYRSVYVEVESSRSEPPPEL